MNNGEYLNTLDNRDKAQAIIDEYGSLLRFSHVEEWLNESRPTTADDDFGKLYYTNNCNCKYQAFPKEEYFEYKNPHTDKLFRIYREKIWFNASSWYDYEITEIKIIADKKRKEAGW